MTTAIVGFVCFVVGYVAGRKDDDNGESWLAKLIKKALAKKKA